MTDNERLASIEAKVDALIRLHQSGVTAPKSKAPNLTVKEFAKLAGVSRWKIQRDIRAFKIKKVNGRVPQDQLTRYTS